MRPTPEQLAAVAKALEDHAVLPRSCAQAAWEVIAPIVRTQVLEEAALACDSVRSNPKDPRYAPQTPEARLAAALCAGSIRQL